MAQPGILASFTFCVTANNGNVHAARTPCVRDDPSSPEVPASSSTTECQRVSLPRHQFCRFADRRKPYLVTENFSTLDYNGVAEAAMVLQDTLDHF